MARPILASSVWPASEKAYLTNSHAASGFLLSFAITNPAEFTPVARPAGPIGIGAMSHLKATVEYSGTDQCPDTPIAATPDKKPSQPYWANCCSVGMDLSSSHMSAST